MTGQFIFTEGYGRRHVSSSTHRTFRRTSAVTALHSGFFRTFINYVLSKLRMS